MDAPRIIVLSTSKKAAAWRSGSAGGTTTAAAAAASPAISASTSSRRRIRRHMGLSLPRRDEPLDVVQVADRLVLLRAVEPLQHRPDHVPLVLGELVDLRRARLGAAEPADAR